MIQSDPPIFPYQEIPEETKIWSSWVSRIKLSMRTTTLQEFNQMVTRLGLVTFITPIPPLNVPPLILPLPRIRRLENTHLIPPLPDNLHANRQSYSRFHPRTLQYV